MVDSNSSDDVVQMSKSREIKVEVAYARPDKQLIIPVTVTEGATLFQAAEQSGMVGQFPEIELDNCRMGIFGKAAAKPKEQVLKAGDRVEIYRPLIADPKEVRRRRAENAKQAKEKS